MRKTCQKCGTESDVDDSPSAACPSCGVIFAKIASSAPVRAKQIEARQKSAGVPFGKIVEIVLWIATVAGALLGAFQVFLTSTSATGAPQQAAGMAMALAYAVVPYVLARAVQEMRR